MQHPRLPQTPLCIRAAELPNSILHYASVKSPKPTVLEWGMWGTDSREIILPDPPPARSGMMRSYPSNVSGAPPKISRHHLSTDFYHPTIIGSNTSW